MSRRLLNYGNYYQKNKNEQYDLLIRRIAKFCCDDKIKKTKKSIYDFWSKLSDDLNDLGPPIRNISGWKKVWSDCRRSSIRRKDIEKVVQKLQQSKSDGVQYNDNFYSHSSNGIEMDSISISDSTSRQSFDTEYKESDCEDNNDKIKNPAEVKLEDTRMESETEMDEYSNNFISYITSEDWPQKKEMGERGRMENGGHFSNFVNRSKESTSKNQHNEQKYQKEPEIEEYTPRYLTAVVGKKHEYKKVHDEKRNFEAISFHSSYSNDDEPSPSPSTHQEAKRRKTKIQENDSRNNVVQEHSKLLEQSLYTLQNQMDMQTKMLENMSNISASMAVLMERQTVAIEKQTEAIRRQAVATEHHTLVMNSFVDMIKERMPKTNSNNIVRNLNAANKN